MNPKQKKFADEWLVDCNGTQAAIRAGYSAKTAEVKGSQLLNTPDIKAYIEGRQAKLSDKVGVTVEMIVAEYKKIAFCDLRTAYDERGILLSIKDIPDGIAASLCGIEVLEQFEGFGKDRIHVGNTVKVKIIEKTKALDALGKHLGMFEKDNAQKQPVINLNAETVTFK